MAQPGAGNQRVAISYFEGVNSTVQHAIAKVTELFHVENARSKIIGGIEKREGQIKVGTTAAGFPFYANENYGLTKFKNKGANQQIFRVSSAPVQDLATLTISVFDGISVGDYPLIGSSNPPLIIKVVDYVTVSEPTIFSRVDSLTILLDGTSDAANIYALDNTGVWSGLTDPNAQNIIGAPFDFAKVDSSLMMVNYKDYNRMIAADGKTITTSTTPGSIFNSPRASKVAYYKSRIYVADFVRNGVEFPTTIMRSSYALGIIALFNGDLATDDGSGNWVIPVTESKYFYADSGMNALEVYRGNIKIADVIVDSVQQTTITASNAHVTFQPGFTGFLSADEIWAGGTFLGDKQYRWMGGSSTLGRDPKMYDTFQLAGGDQDPITMMMVIGNVMLIANSNTLMSWNDYLLENMDLGVGCVSRRGYVKLMGSCYFIHYSGIYSTTGGVPTLLSRKVDRYLKGATKSGLENCATGFKGLSVFFAIGDVTLYNKDDSFLKTMKDVCLEFNVADQTWFVHTNVPAEQFATFIDPTGPERLLMDHNKAGNSIKEFLTGNTDDGDAIFFRVDTQPIQFQKSFELYADPIEITTEIDRGASMKCFVSLDEDEAFYEIDGIFRKGTSTLKITSKDPQYTKIKPCRKMTVSFRDSSKQLAKLIQTSVSYIPTNMSTPNNEGDSQL